ncbi:MAG: hypothetical protein OHK0028_04140 [Deltaproteobacteria bacterium]
MRHAGNRHRIPRSRLLTLLLLAAFAGCHRGARVETPLPPPAPERAPYDNTVSDATMEWLPPAVPLIEPAEGEETAKPAEPPVAPEGGGEGKAAGSGPAVGVQPAAASTDNASIVPAPPSPGAPEPAPTRIATPPPSEPSGPGPVEAAPAAEKIAEPSGPAPSGPGTSDAAAGATRKNGRPHAGSSPPKANHGEAAASGIRGTHEPDSRGAVPPKEGRGQSLPGWARRPEELVYRVDFIGITMGYARFRYEGKVSIGGKTAYHLNVRAWTSGALSYIYPINETIDYYLDEETLAPIRQEFTQRERDKDDVATYDQESGTITYRYRQTGKIRKRVVTVPSIYDPVSVAYYFRWRDLGSDDRPRNVYAGRKVWQISARLLGNERIRTARGEIDAIAVRPVIRKDGKVQDKGDLKIWFSGDERRVPVRLFAKFRKIKDWTLVGELMAPGAGAGG